MNIKIYRFLLPFIYSITSGMNILPYEVMERIVPFVDSKEALEFSVTCKNTLKLRTEEQREILSILDMKYKEDVSGLYKKMNFENIYKIFTKDNIRGIDIIGKLNHFKSYEYALDFLYHCIADHTCSEQADFIARLTKKRGFYIFDFIRLINIGCDSYRRAPWLIETYEKTCILIDVAQITNLMPRGAIYQLAEDYIKDVTEATYPKHTTETYGASYHRFQFTVFLNHMHEEVRNDLFMKMTELDQKNIAVSFTLSFFVIYDKPETLQAFRSSGVVQFLRESDPKVARKIFSSMFKQVDTLNKRIHYSNCYLKSETPSFVTREKHVYGLFAPERDFDHIGRLFKGNLFNIAALNTCFAKPGYEHIRQEILEEIRRIVPNFEHQLQIERESCRWELSDNYINEIRFPSYKLFPSYNFVEVMSDHLIYKRYPLEKY